MRTSEVASARVAELETCISSIEQALTRLLFALERLPEKGSMDRVVLIE